MKKAVKYIVISLTLIAVLLCLASCGSARKKLVGKWAADGTYYRFSELEIFSDGTYSSDHANYSGRYSVEGNRIKFNGILVETLVFSFEIKGDTLTFYFDDNDKEPCAIFAKQ